MSATIIIDQAREAAAKVLRPLDGKLAPGEREVIARAVETAARSAVELALRESAN